jgi:hypothetical protein
MLKSRENLCAIRESDAVECAVALDVWFTSPPDLDLTSDWIEALDMEVACDLVDLAMLFSDWVPNLLPASEAPLPPTNQ